MASGKCEIPFHFLDGTARFNESRRHIPGATQRPLTKPSRSKGAKLETDMGQFQRRLTFSRGGIFNSVDIILPAIRGGELLDARPPRRSGFELTQFGVDGTVGASVVATEAANPIHLLVTLQARAQNAFRYRS